MPYRRILEELLSRVAGARTALLLDAQGEVVVGAGNLDERQRLIGAYQGIALGMVSRAAQRVGVGEGQGRFLPAAGEVDVLPGSAVAAITVDGGMGGCNGRLGGRFVAPGTGSRGLVVDRAIRPPARVVLVGEADHLH